MSPLFLWDTFSATLARELDASVTSLSLAYSVGLAMFTVGVLVGGRIADSIAPRRLAAYIAAGVAAGLGATAIAPSVAVLVLGYGVVLGGATGLGYATAVRVAGTMPGGRGWMVALVVSAYAAGAVVLSPVVDLLLGSVGRATTFAALAVGLGTVVACAAVLLPPTVPGGRAASSRMAAVLPYRGRLVGLWAMFLLGSGPALVAFGHAGEFAREPDLAATAVLLLNAGNFAGRLIAGPVADWIGTTGSLHLTGAMLVASCAVLGLVDTVNVALAALLVLGTQYGAVSVLTPLAVSATVPADRFGTAYGMVFSGWGLVGLVGPVAAASTAVATNYAAVAGGLTAVGVLFWAAVVWVSRSPPQPRPA